MHYANAGVMARARILLILFYRKIHYLTREFHVKLHLKTDIALIASRFVKNDIRDS